MIELISPSPLLVPDEPLADVGGQARSRPATETLARVGRYQAEAGVSRLADITGLDRIGIPVWQAIRPNAKVLVGSMGKGHSSEAAATSALMEAIEMHHAENLTLPTFVIQPAQANQCGIDWLDCTPIATNGFQRWPVTQPLSWVWGYRVPECVGEGWQPVAVPRALVEMVSPPAYEVAPWQRSSNGLSSGNNLIEAVLAGLLELVERDADALAAAGGEARPVVSLAASAAAPDVRQLAAQVSNAGLSLAVTDITSELGIPTFRAVIWDPNQPDDLTALGAGAHLSADLAASRAITEAAQSRAGFIAGARDDIAGHRPRPRVSRQRPVEATVSEVAGGWSSRLPDSCAVAVTHVVSRLAAAGLTDVVAVPLVIRSDYAVVRVIVPGLEGPHRAYRYVPGQRARAVRSAAP